MKTYGTITYDDGWFYIHAQPHVRIRIKRIFSRLENAGQLVRLQALPEIAFELDWLTKRYPMQVEESTRKRLEQLGQQWVERQTAIERIIEAPDYTPPLFMLSLPPRAYQAQAADMVLKSGHLLLADDVGLGKTASGICVLTEREALPALVVTMTHLPKQWRSELAKFAPTLRTHIVKKGSPYDLHIGWRGRREPFPDVIISNYAKLAGWAEVLSGTVRTVIFDEVQELRHAGTDRYDAATQIAHAARWRMGLSATPVYNYAGEIFNIMEVLAPGSLGFKHEFTREWCTVIAAVGDGEDRLSAKEPSALGTYLREQGLLLRRTRAEVGRELPELTVIPHHIDADLDKISELTASVAELARTILAQQGITNEQRMRAGAELDWKLRMATGVAKAPYVAEFVRMLVETGEPVVLYGWHHEVYSIWADKLKDLHPVFYTGKESPTQKEAAKRAFVRGDSKVFVMSLRAGAGLDGLQEVCAVGVFGELDWSPMVHTQCIGRYHRDGQKKPAVAYYLLAEDGSDPVVADILGIKRAQSEGILNPTGNLFEPIKNDGGSHIARLARDFLERHGKGKERAA